MKLLAFLVLSVLTVQAGAQASVKGGALNINTSRLTSIESIPLKDEPGLDGEIYLVEDLHNGTIQFGRFKIENHLFRYDVSNDLFEIAINEKLKYLNGYGVKQFEIFNSDSTIRNFVRIDEDNTNEEKFWGYFEIIVEGQVTLVGYHYTTLLPPNYIHGLDVGRRSETSVLKTRYFFKMKNDQLFEIKKKKDLVNKFEESDGDIDQFIKRNRIDLKKREKLISLTNFLNTTERPE